MIRLIAYLIMYSCLLAVVITLLVNWLSPKPKPQKEVKCVKCKKNLQTSSIYVYKTAEGWYHAACLFNELHKRE